KVAASFDHLPNAKGTIAAAPRAGQWIRKIRRRGPVVGRRDPAALWVGQTRHPLERNQAVPLMYRVPAWPVAAFPNVANRHTASCLIADMAVRVGEDDAERGHVPGPSGLAEFLSRLRAVHAEQRRQPAALVGTEPFE